MWYNVKMRRNSTLTFIITAAGIAAVYAVCTLLQAFSAFGSVQFRVAEALTVLPFYSPAAIAGLTLGCAIANGIASPMPLDIIIGTLASLIAALLTRVIRIKWLAPLPPVLVNAVFMGAMLTFYETGGFPLSLLAFHMGSIAFWQALVCYGLGLPLLVFLERTVFKNKD